MSGRNKDGVCMRGWFGVLFLHPCEDACGRGLSIDIRGKYDMRNEVKLLEYPSVYHANLNGCSCQFPLVLNIKNFEVLCKFIW